jgi:glycerol kinase
MNRSSRRPAGWSTIPAEIWNNTREVIGSALSKANLTRHDIAAVGITNQRETAVVWDKTTGKADLQRHRVAGHPHPAHRG